MKNDIITGALYDFLGHITSRDEEMVCSAHHDATGPLRVLMEWAKNRGLDMEELPADVKGWWRRIE